MSHYAVHGSELPYAFHWRLGMISNTEVADMISSYWGNFVLSDVHDPNIAMVDYNASSGDDTLPKWPVYTKTGDEVMVLADKASTASSSALKEEQCKFHIQSIEAEIRADFGH
jgi:carboxylesterase type B